MRLYYLIASGLGALLPLSQFLPWVVSNGMAIPYMVQLALANPVSAFAWLDVLISGLVLLAFMLSDGHRLKIEGLWLPVLGLCLIGVSFALPFYLWMRERKAMAPESL